MLNNKKMIKGLINEIGMVSIFIIGLYVLNLVIAR